MWKLASLLEGAAVLLLCAGSAHAATLDEYQAKAVFLYKFATFVEWPAGALGDNSKPFTICVMGQTPVEAIVADAVKSKRFEGRGFAVRQASTPREALGCGMLFVSEAGVRRFLSLRSELTLSGVLVVGETDGFATEGGIINLRLRDGRLHVEINAAAAKRARLLINARLLGMAEVVGK